MQTSATRLLENIIREELALIRENNGPSDLKKYEGKSLPEPTAGSIQKFLGIPIDGDFGDETAKAVANFIYGPNTGHGIDTVEELYDRMKQDRWDVGAKTGTIFANNGKMANSILDLMSMRTAFTGAGRVMRISTEYLDHPAYSNYPNINKVKYGLDYGGRDKWSTTELRDFLKKKENPYKPAGIKSNLTHKEQSEIFQNFIKRSFAGVNNDKCTGLEKLMKRLSTININELAMLSYHYNKKMFQYIIDFGVKYYPYSLNGKLHTGKCGLHPDTMKKIHKHFFAVENHIDKVIDLRAGQFAEFERIGDIWVDLKINIANSLYDLGQYINLPNSGFEASNGPVLGSVKSNMPIKSNIPKPSASSYFLVGAGSDFAYTTYNLGKKYPHEVALIASIGLSFMGPIGLLASGAIMAIDSYSYYKEGDYENAGLSAIFAVLPFMRISGIPRLTRSQWTKFGQRVANSRYSQLAKADKLLLQQVAKQKDAIKATLTKLVGPAAKRTAGKWTIESLRNNPVNLLLRKLANGTLTLAKLGADFAIGTIPYMAANEAWALIMKLYGLDEKQIEAMSEYEIQEFLKQSETINVD